MHVAAQRYRVHAVESLQIVSHLPQQSEAAWCSHVTEMRRDHDAPVPTQSDCRFHLSAECHHRMRQAEGQVAFDRCIAPAEADRPWLADDDAVHRVVGRPRNRPVVMQEPVHHLAEAVFDLSVVGQDRFARGIG